MENNLETKLKELNNLVEKINDDKTSIEESIEIYEKAVVLARECYEVILAANGKIQELSKKLENTITDLKEFE